MQIPLAHSPRRVALLLMTVGVLIAGGLALGGAPGARAQPRPHLTLVKGNPVTISGRGFRARVRVRVLLMSRGTFTRRPMTSRQGRFTVTFPTRLDRCSGWSVTVTQPGRAPVVLRSPAKPLCAPL